MTERELERQTWHRLAVLPASHYDVPAATPAIRTCTSWRWEGIFPLPPIPRFA
jgi:hypothetical protein